MMFHERKAISAMFGTPAAAPSPAASQTFKFRQIKLSDFISTHSAAPNFLNKLQNLMEIPGYSLGPTKELVTTPSNQDASNTIRQTHPSTLQKRRSQFLEK